jgi:hypothetical protein
VTATKSYAGQDVPSSGSVRVLDGGSTLKLEGNRWRSTTSQTFTVTPSTVLEFDFLSTSEGEIHGIGFDENDRSDDRRVFQISGFQTGARTLTPDTVYTRAGSYQRIRIPVGQYYTGDAMYLVIVNDKDRGRMDNTSYFRNVRIVNEDRRAAVWTGARWSIPAGATVR